MKTLASPLPVMAAVFAVAVLSTMDAAIKAVSLAHPTGQVVFLRYLAGLIALSLLMLLPAAGRPTLGTFQRAAVRALFILSTAFLFFKTLTLLPLAEAVAVSFTAPFFMVFAARILLKEAVPSSAWLAICIGFLGVVVMLVGRLSSGEAVGGDPFGYVTGIACSVTYAIAMVMTRKDSGRDTVLALVLAQNASAALFSLPVALWVWTPPAPDALILFAVIGALGTAGHLAFAWAYAHAPTARLAPIEYTGFLWAGVFGAVFFGELPTVWTLVGAALIVGACLMVFRRPA